jgi:tRNA pseudouridine55 synthase
VPVYIVNKPLGFTSHDVVAKARKLLHTRRVGHAGTLDPLASGVLVLLGEEATKLSPFLTASEKAYLAWVSFGASTPTLDAEGPVEATGDASSLSRAQVEVALPPFLDLKEQLPPQYSAIKKGGVKGYEAARKGERLELSPRPAGYRRIALLAFAENRDALPKRFSFIQGSWQPHEDGITFQLPDTLGSFLTVLFSLQVKAGTYIRAFARDLGEALGLPAHLSGLVRTRAGRFGLEQAVRLEELPHLAGLSMAEALPYPRLTLSDKEVARVRQGQRLALKVEGRVGLMSPQGELVAVAEVQGGQVKLLRVWPA